MSLNVGQVLVVLALITFVIAALGWTYRRIDLVAIGLALWSLASLVSRVPLVFRHFVGPLGTVPSCPSWPRPWGGAIARST